MPWRVEVDLTGGPALPSPLPRYAVLRALARRVGPDRVLAFAIDGRWLEALVDGPHPTDALGRSLKAVVQRHRAPGGAREATWVEAVDDVDRVEQARAIEARVAPRSPWSSRAEALGARRAGFLCPTRQCGRLGRPRPTRWHALPHRPSLPRIVQAAAACQGLAVDHPVVRATTAAVACDLGHEADAVGDLLAVGPRQLRRMRRQARHRGACRRYLGLRLRLP